MEGSPSTPPPDERAALDQLERIEAVVRAAPTRRVLWRAQVMLDGLLRAREFAQAGRDFDEALDDMRREIQERGLPPPTAEEIEAENDAARAERGSP